MDLQSLTSYTSSKEYQLPEERAYSNVLITDYTYNFHLSHTSYTHLLLGKQWQCGVNYLVKDHKQNKVPF